MQGVVFDIKRGGLNGSPGISTSVLLTGGALRCIRCHNPESQAAEIQRAVTTGEVCGRVMSVDAVMGDVLRDAVFYRTSGGGVTFTGGEPMLQFDFLKALCAAARAAGVHVAVDTSGFAPWEQFAELLPLVDLFLYDLKCMDSERHARLTGVPNELILENLRRLDAAGAKIWVRCPLVPGLNDSDSDLAAIRAFTDTLHHMEKLEVCPYHPLGLEKCTKFGLEPRYAEKAQPTSADLARWRAALMY